MSTTARRDEDPTHYQAFASALELAQAPLRQGLTKAQWAARHLEMQNRQIPALLAAERRFVDALRRVPRGIRVFSELCALLEGDRQQAVLVRTMSRERNQVFQGLVLPAARRRYYEYLPDLAWNWAFVQHAWRFARPPEHIRLSLAARCPGALPEPAERCFGVGGEVLRTMVQATEEIYSLRHELVVTNLLLVVDRARAFQRCTPATLHSSQMDLISVATEGLLAGMDKVMLECRPAPHWEPTWHPVAGFAYWRGQSASPDPRVFEMPTFAYSGYRIEGHHTASKHVAKEERPQCPASVFRTTAIGRMGAQLIKSYSQTHMHMGPDDKRLLYQANRVASRNSDGGRPDYEGMATQILRDRVAYTLSVRTRLDSRQVSRAMAEALDELDESADWRAVSAKISAHSTAPEGQEEETPVDPRLEQLETIAPEVVRRARADAPTAEQVAGVMLANSFVPCVDDEGEDKSDALSSHAAPEDQRPDLAAERAGRSSMVHRVLKKLSILERKLLVLLDLAPLDCLQPT